MLTTLLTWHLATTGVLLAALVLVVAVQGTTARARALRTALHTARSRSSARAAAALPAARLEADPAGVRGAVSRAA